MENSFEDIVLLISKEKQKIEISQFSEKEKEYLIKFKRSSKGILLSKDFDTLKDDYSIIFSTYSMLELKNSLFVTKHLIERIEDNEFSFYTNDVKKLQKTFPLVDISVNDFEEYYYVISNEVRKPLTSFFNKNKEMLANISIYQDINISNSKKGINLSILKKTNDIVDLEKNKRNIEKIGKILKLKFKKFKLYKLKNQSVIESV